jgi:hypothetical protein
MTEVGKCIWQPLLAATTWQQVIIIRLLRAPSLRLLQSDWQWLRPAVVYDWQQQCISKSSIAKLT